MSAGTSGGCALAHSAKDELAELQIESAVFHGCFTGNQTTFSDDRRMSRKIAVGKGYELKDGKLVPPMPLASSNRARARCQLMLKLTRASRGSPRGDSLLAPRRWRNFPVFSRR